MAEPMTNWSGTLTYRARRVLRPRSVPELQEIVAASDRIRAIGSAHSFNDVADTDGDLVSVGGLPPEIVIDGAARTVSVAAGMRYGEIAGPLNDAGLALHNLGSLPHISVAGACATGTHGSGVGNGALPTAVVALQYVDASGELVESTREQADFAGSVVALGGLGIATRVTLAVEPAYEIRQTVYDDLPMAVLLDDFDDIMGAAYSVSVFTDWHPHDRFTQVWQKARPDESPDAPRGARAADGPRHPLRGMSARSCTVQGGVPGPWHLRLPHFRLEFTPSSGEEIQTEYFVARSAAVDALRALEPIAAEIAGVLQVSEIRSIAADDLWLSMAYGRDSVAIHFTWVKNARAVARVVELVERALEPFAPRPHWGKVFAAGPQALAARYPRYDDFRELLARRDPGRVFANDFLDRCFAAR
ncbi:MAG: alditol oxidase [Frankiaceae bacterium]|nr:alditol oxidase [Frankiaceae bacterium]